MCKQIVQAIMTDRWTKYFYSFLLQHCEQPFDNQTLLRRILIDYITYKLPPKKIGLNQ